MTQAAREAFHAAVALQGSGDLDKALIAFRRAQELDPEDDEIAYRTASALLQTGQIDEALLQLRRVVFANPEHMPARASLGNCQFLLGDIDNARQNFESVLAREPDNLNALYGMTKVLLHTGLPREATLPARRLMDLMPGSSEALTLFADTQKETGQRAPAMAAYRKALRIDPAYVPALLGLAKCMLLGRRYDDAVGCAIKASAQRPADPYPLELLSEILSAKGALADAREAAESALELATGSVGLRVHLSVLCRRLGDNAGALEHALAGYDLGTSEPGPLNALGAALAALKNMKAAKNVLTGLSDGRPLDASVREQVEKIISASDKRPLAPAPAPPDDKETTPSHGSEDKLLALQDDEAVQIQKHENGAVPNVLGLHRRDES